METAFKGLGYKVETRELSHFYDDYGLQAPEGEDGDEDEEDEEDDEGDYSGSDDGSEESEED